jgi:hypothetical protein
MSFPFNFERNDEQFLAQIHGNNKNRASLIAIMSKLRLWLFWTGALGALLSLVSFILSCIDHKPDFGAFFSPTIGLLVFVIIDFQIKAFKLAQANDNNLSTDA